MDCRPPAQVLERSSTITVANSTTGIVRPDWVSSGDAFVAMEIGPHSDYEQLLVFPDGKVIPSPVAHTNGRPGVVGTPTDAAYELLADAVRVAVGCPYVGPFRGPIRVLDMYGLHVDDASARQVLPTKALDLNGVAASWVVHLLLHRDHPGSFSTRRPPDRRRRIFTNYGGTTAAFDAMVIPAMGREDLILGYLSTGNTGGTTTLRVYGVMQVDTQVKELLDTISVGPTGVGVAASAVYEYEGKFDFYIVSIQTAAVTAAADLELYSQVRDK